MIYNVWITLYCYACVLNLLEWHYTSSTHPSLYPLYYTILHTYYHPTHQAEVSAFDSKVFWGALYLTPLVWAIFLFLGVLRLKLEVGRVICNGIGWERDRLTKGCLSACMVFWAKHYLHPIPIYGATLYSPWKTYLMCAHVIRYVCCQHIPQMYTSLHVTSSKIANWTVVYAYRDRRSDAERGQPAGLREVQQQRPRQGPLHGQQASYQHCLCYFTLQYQTLSRCTVLHCTALHVFFTAYLHVHCRCHDCKFP